MVVFGRCGSGRYRDCKNDAGDWVVHGIECCPIAMVKEGQDVVIVSYS